MTARSDKGIELTAAKPKRGMTLEELRTFVMIATDDGIPGDTVPSVGIGWHSQLQKIRIDYSQERKP